jgi:hypothetical protein
MGFDSHIRRFRRTRPAGLEPIRSRARDVPWSMHLPVLTIKTHQDRQGFLPEDRADSHQRGQHEQQTRPDLAERGPCVPASRIPDRWHDPRDSRDPGETGADPYAARPRGGCAQRNILLVADPAGKTRMRTSGFLKRVSMPTRSLPPQPRPAQAPGHGVASSPSRGPACLCVPRRRAPSPGRRPAARVGARPATGAAASCRRICETFRLTQRRIDTDSRFRL